MGITAQFDSKELCASLVEEEPLSGDVVGAGGGTADHRKLANRNAKDQHPMSAITGLDKALEDKSPSDHTHTASDVGARPDTWMPAASDVGARPDTWTPTAEEVGARPNTWTPTAAEVGASPAGHAHTAEQIGASPTGHTHTAEEVGARPNTWIPTADQVGARPDTWTPTAEEVGARPNTWMPTAEQVGARPATWMPTAEDVGADPAGSAANVQRNLEATNLRIDSIVALPEGSTAGDAELMDIRVGTDGKTYESAGAAVRGQVESLTSMIDLAVENTKLAAISNGHFYKLNSEQGYPMKLWQEVDGVISERRGMSAGSAIMKCPSYLCMNFLDGAGGGYIYFYELVNGEYVPNWDIINLTTSDGAKNWLKPDNAKSRFKLMLEVPDGMYVQFRFPDGRFEFYGWDGEKFGIPVSADCSVPANAGTESYLMDDGSFGITILGSAEFVVSNGCTMGTINGYVSGVSTNLDVNYAKGFVALPSGYEYFRIRCTPARSKITAYGDVSDMISVVMPTQSERASGLALKVLENARRISELRWKPVAEVPVASSWGGVNFDANVEYQGIPYGSNWKLAHYIGWHVSPHTFVNAVNDGDSIFYNETVSDDNDKTAPYYGTVCSAFATMCAGWPYPEINRGMLHDPNLYVNKTMNPPIGSLYVNTALNHVVIPERVDYNGDNIAISTYESTRPVCGRITRHSAAGESLSGNDADNMYEYSVHHSAANLNMSTNVPYLDLDDVGIVNGTARPYKGDKSVYTSEEDSVKINIKTSSATQLYLAKGSNGEATGNATTIPINGATQIDVKNYLSGDGLYVVWTDAGEVKEHFEYRTVEDILYRINDGVPELVSNDFFYVMFQMYTEPTKDPDKRAVVTALPSDDYSYLCQNGRSCDYVYALFRKGTYGAYTVPFRKTT